MLDRSHELVVAHHHPGHLRLRSRALEGRAGAERAATVVGPLRAIEGVLDVRTSALTGAILVRYDVKRVGPDVIVEAVSQSVGLAVGSGKHEQGDEDRLAYIAIDVVRELNVLMQELTHHRADLRILVPAALAGLGVWSAAEHGIRIPPWDNLLYWSYAVFVAANDPAVHRDGRASLPEQRP